MGLKSKSVVSNFTMASIAVADAADANVDSAMKEPTSHCILAFYKFVETPIEGTTALPELRAKVTEILRFEQARGNVLLAAEGTNGTVCYPLEKQSEQNRVLQFLQEIFPGIRTRISWSEKSVFTRLKVKIKNEIVTMGLVAAADQQAVELLQASPGEYVPPDQWNALIRDPNVLVVDTRNEYEISLGTFANAVNPSTESFVEFPAWIDQQLSNQQEQQDEQQKPKAIAMFCTGGIRCEKATAYCRKALQQQQQQASSAASAADIPVYHLEGGILAYLDTIPATESLFRGDCFVFDQRLAVQTGLEPVAADKYSLCHACRAVLRSQDLESGRYEAGISCPSCWEHRAERKARYRERQRQIDLSLQRGTLHLHDSKEQPATAPSCKKQPTATTTIIREQEPSTTALPNAQTLAT